MHPERRLAVGGLLLVAVVVSLLAYPELPAEMTTHWNVSGEADDTLPRALALVLAPVAWSRS